MALGGGAFAAAVPWSVRAQVKSVLIAYLSTTSRHSQGDVLGALREGLAALGWKEGVNLTLEGRWADGRYEQLQLLAEELTARKPAIIVARDSRAGAAAAKAAPTTPIVMAGGDPLATGLVSNLARPGGMITGVTNILTEINAKYVGLLLDANPKLRRIGFLGDANNPARVDMTESARRAALQRSIEARFADAANSAEIDSAIARLSGEGVQAFVVAPSPLFTSQLLRIAKLAAAQRLAWIGGQDEYAAAGALFSYGADRSALHRRAAYYVDRILKGAKPGDLPIEQPTKLDLVVNMKTAKALGLTIPQDFLMRADRVIE